MRRFGRLTMTLVAVLAIGAGGAVFAGCGDDESDAEKATKEVNEAVDQAQEDLPGDVQEQVDEAVDQAQEDLPDDVQQQIDDAQQEAQDAADQIQEDVQQQIEDAQNQAQP